MTSVDHVFPVSGGSVYEEVLRAARLIMQPGSVHELRIPNAGRERTVAGYYDDPERLAKSAEKLDAAGRYPGIFITLNPCNPDLFLRCGNRAEPYTRVTTSDADIIRRVWLLVDIDPRRPAGISSTEQEHGRAISVACGIWDDLRGVGFGDPVVCDSGNGAHLLYLLDLRNDRSATALMQRTLKGIARHCEPDDVSVDLSVYNAARIVKLYGTISRKGDSTPERPHRRSRILEVPERMEPIRLGVA